MALPGVFFRYSDLLQMDFEGFDRVDPSIKAFCAGWVQGQSWFDFQTSGSTGQPGLIRFSRSAVEASARLTGSFFGFGSGSTLLHCLPMQYIAGKMMVARALVCKTDLLVLPPASNPLVSLDLDLRVDFAALVPLQVSAILANRVSRERFYAISDVIVGGASLGTDLTRQLTESANRVWETFGMTETLTHVALRRISGPGRQGCFEALPGIQFGVDKRSCLTIQAPHLGVGDIQTNDVVTLTDTRHFVWQGRDDLVINSGGVKVFPEKVEEKLQSLVAVPFFITSEPDANLGSQVVLVIEGPEWETGRQALLEAAMKVNLGRYELPRRICFRDRFLRSEAGKIRRIASFEGG